MEAILNWAEFKSESFVAARVEAGGSVSATTPQSDGGGRYASVEHFSSDFCLFCAHVPSSASFDYKWVKVKFTQFSWVNIPLIPHCVVNTLWEKQQLAHMLGLFMLQHFLGVDCLSKIKKCCKCDGNHACGFLGVCFSVWIQVMKGSHFWFHRHEVGGKVCGVGLEAAADEPHVTSAPSFCCTDLMHFFCQLQSSRKVSSF